MPFAYADVIERLERLGYEVADHGDIEIGAAERLQDPETNMKKFESGLRMRMQSLNQRSMK